MLEYFRQIVSPFQRRNPFCENAIKLDFDGRMRRALLVSSLVQSCQFCLPRVRARIANYNNTVFTPSAFLTHDSSGARLSFGFWYGFGRAEISLYKVFRLFIQKGSKANGNALLLSGVVLGCNPDISMAEEA